LTGKIKREIEKMISIISGQQGCIVEELNVQDDHVHLLVMVPPKISISKYVGMVKGKTAIRIFKEFPNLKIKPYWGKSFLGKRILCRYNWIRFRKNKKVR